MANTFSAQISDWVRKSESRLRAVVKGSAQKVLEEAQRVGPSVANPSGGEGGKMPVDTGFLRASMSVSLSGMPTGPSQNPHKTTSVGGTYKGPKVRYADEGSELVLSGMKIGDTIYAGWTAEYAPFMELRYGFMRSAAQLWPSIVDKATEEAKARHP